MENVKDENDRFNTITAHITQIDVAKYVEFMKKVKDGNDAWNTDTHRCKCWVHLVSWLQGSP